MYPATKDKGSAMPFQVLRTVRLHWLLLSIVLMFGSAYFAMLWIGAVGAISGWIGLPAYAAALEKVQHQAQWWKALTLLLPFAAASVLMLRKRLPSDAPGVLVEARGLVVFLQQYAIRLIASIIGALCFLLVLFLISLLFYKLGIHSRGLAPVVSESAILLGRWRTHAFVACMRPSVEDHLVHP